FIGSVMDYLDGRKHRGEPKMPRNICLPYLLSSRRGHPSRDAGPYGHFLGHKYDPLWAEFQGGSPRLLRYHSRAKYHHPFAGITPDGALPLGSADTLAEEITLGRFEDRRALLTRLDAASRAFAQQDAIRNFDRNQQRAFSLTVNSRTREALDISREPLSLPDPYGLHLFGPGPLSGRRMVSGGARHA